MQSLGLCAQSEFSMEPVGGLLADLSRLQYKSAHASRLRVRVDEVYFSAVSAVSAVQAAHLTNSVKVLSTAAGVISSKLPVLCNATRTLSQSPSCGLRSSQPKASF